MTDSNVIDFQTRKQEKEEDAMWEQWTDKIQYECMKTFFAWTMESLQEYYGERR